MERKEQKNKVTTIEELRKAEEQRKANIADLYNEMAAYEGKRKAEEKALYDAVKSGNREAIKACQRNIDECNQEKAAIMRIVEYVDQNRFYTDKDVISAANYEVNKTAEKLSAGIEEYNKTAAALVKCAKELCSIYQATVANVKEVLNYHSGIEKFDTRRGAYQSFIDNEGLNLPKRPPAMNPIAGLLIDQFGADTQFSMISITNGSIDLV